MPFRERHPKTTVEQYADEFYTYDTTSEKLIDFNMLSTMFMVCAKLIMLRWKMVGLCYPNIKEFDDFFVETYDLQAIRNSGVTQEQMQRMLIKLPEIMRLAGTRKGLEKLLVLKNQASGGTVFVPVIDYSFSENSCFDGEHYYGDRYTANGEGISFNIGAYEIHLTNSSTQLKAIIERFKSVRDIIVIDP